MKKYLKQQEVFTNEGFKINMKLPVCGCHKKRNTKCALC